jgi:hypothetical protein
MDLCLLAAYPYSVHFHRFFVALVFVRLRAIIMGPVFRTSIRPVQESLGTASGYLKSCSDATLGAEVQIPKVAGGAVLRKNKMVEERIQCLVNILLLRCKLSTQ